MLLKLPLTIHAHVLPIPIYTLVKVRFKFENDEVERILSRTCTFLCYILEYIYIRQTAKRHTSPVFAFNMHDQTLYQIR